MVTGDHLFVLLPVANGKLKLKSIVISKVRDNALTICLLICLKLLPVSTILVPNFFQLIPKSILYTIIASAYISASF